MQRFGIIAVTMLCSGAIQGAWGNTVTETFTDTNSAPWSPIWSADNLSTQANQRLYISNNEGRYGAFGGVQAYLNCHAAIDVDQKVLVRCSGGNNFSFGIIARRADANSNTYYVCQLNNSTLFRVGRQIDGATTWLDSTNGVTGFTGQSNWWMRFCVSSTDDIAYLVGHLWETTKTESAGYAVSAMDTNLALKRVEGRFGLSFGVNNRTIIVDDYQAVYLGRRGFALSIR